MSSEGAAVASVKTSATGWFLVSTVDIPALASRKVLPSNRIQLYASGLALTPSPAGLTWSAGPAAAGPSDHWSPTRLEVDENSAQITISAMNEVPVYIVTDPLDHRRALASSDLLLAASIAAGWGMASVVDASRPSGRDGSTILDAVRLVAPGHRLRLRARSAEEVNPALTVEAAVPDPLPAGRNPSLADPIEAGQLLLEALDHAILTTVGRGRPVGVLLSAGVDSGTVTALAVRQGLSVVAYSAGTPWGNEHPGAAELCAHLGITQVQRDLSIEELVAAIPETVRWLGSAEPEKVDIGLIPMALLQSGLPAEDVVLTGYGSDLLNLGLPPALDATPAAMITGLLAAIDETRYSGELSPLHFLGRGKQLVHPFWDPCVISLALRTRPEVKLYQGRDKGHLRAAADGLLPSAVAWRRKVAVHHGGGLQAGLDAFFGGAPRKRQAYAECLANLQRAVEADPLGSASGAGR